MHFSHTCDQREFLLIFVLGHIWKHANNIGFNFNSHSLFYKFECGGQKLTAEHQSRHLGQHACKQLNLLHVEKIIIGSPQTSTLLLINTSIIFASSISSSLVPPHWLWLIVDHGFPWFPVCWGEGPQSGILGVDVSSTSHQRPDLSMHLSPPAPLTFPLRPRWLQDRLAGLGVERLWWWIIVREGRHAKISHADWEAWQLQW